MKLKYLASVVLACGMLSSCDYTDLNPMSGFTDGSYWNSVQDLQLYANGLMGNFGGATWTAGNESDDFVTSDISSYLFNTMVLDDASGWDWTVVRNCNFFLARYDRVQGDEAEINNYVAIVRMIRANDYYNKIRRFGDVPWYDKDLQTNDTEELYKARDPRNFVLGKIIEDLQFAAKWLPTRGNTTVGYPSRDAAKALLSRICLYYGTYMKYHNEAANNGYGAEDLLKLAAQYSGEIMATGDYAIPAGTDAGADVVSYAEYPLPYSNQFIQNDLQSNKETIFARYYALDLVTHEVGRAATEAAQGLTKAFVESYLMKDGTPIYNEGSGYQGDDTYEHEFANRDPRMYQTVGSKDRIFWSTNEGGEEPTPYAVFINTAVTGYQSWKFHSSNRDQWQPRSSFFDWFFYRYGEVLLINAEANYELGSCTQTVLDNTINLLRDRVGMAHLTTSPVADAKPLDYGYAVDPLLYEIRRERRVEMVNEGQRLDDLKRWNAMKLLEDPKTMLGIRVSPEMQAVFNDAQAGIDFTQVGTLEYDGNTYVAAYPNQGLYPAGRKWTADDKRWLYPIPLQQTVLNPNLKQNPGWTQGN